MRHDKDSHYIIAPRDAVSSTTQWDKYERWPDTSTTRRCTLNLCARRYSSIPCMWHFNWHLIIVHSHWHRWRWRGRRNICPLVHMSCLRYFHFVLYLGKYAHVQLSSTQVGGCHDTFYSRLAANSACPPVIWLLQWLSRGGWILIMWHSSAIECAHVKWGKCIKRSCCQC